MFVLSIPTFIYHIYWIFLVVRVIQHVVEALEKYLHVGAFSPENRRLSGTVWRCWEQER